MLEIKLTINMMLIKNIKVMLKVKFLIIINMCSINKIDKELNKMKNQT